MIIGGEDGFYNGIALRGVAQPLALYELLQALLDTRIHKESLVRLMPAGELEISTLAFFLLGLKSTQ
jgi:hypothetical protein